MAESSPLFEVLESGSKGLGGFAIRDIHVGERILAERPLAQYRSRPNECEESAASGLAAVIDELSQADQRQFYGLSQCARHGTAKTALHIWSSNAYPTDNAGESGVCSSVFAQACRLNHDCRPNAHIIWNERIGMQTVHALCEISQGEEVLVAYIGGDADGTRAARQLALQTKFSFACTCPQCELTGASLERSETRQRRINEIVKRLATRPADTLALINERCGLMELEQMPTIWGASGALLALLEMPHTGSAATRKLAWSVASSAQDYCQTALGADAHETIAFASFANLPVFAALQRKKRGQGKRAPTTAAAGTAAAPAVAVAKPSRAQRQMVQARSDEGCVDELAAHLQAAKLALAGAEADALASGRREVEARARAGAAVQATSAAGHELLTLARDGLRGSLWTFASGTFDNQRISWTEFEYAASKLADSVRRTLVNDSLDADLLSHLQTAPYATHWASATRAGAHSEVLRLRSLMSASACTALRELVDAERDRTTDTVDHFAQHTRSLSLTRLASLIGVQTVERLKRLPMELLSQRSHEANERARVEARVLRDGRARAVETAPSAADAVDVATSDATRLQAALGAAKAAATTAHQGATGGFAEHVYVRRYSRDTRPWLGFHTDHSVVTINVALAPDASHEGGRLHAVLGGQHCIVEREEGEATVHGDDVMHAVSAMRAGVRYSLVLLFFLNSGTAPSVASLV